MTQRYSKQPSQRQLMVSNTMHRILAEAIVSYEIHHPELRNELLSVAQVKISPDLKIATVFVIVRSCTKDTQEQMLSLLQKLSNEIRHIVTKKLHLRYAPEIRFMLDDTLDKMSYMDGVFNKLAVK
ncbi:Ribosome-binding factor A [Alphaproteobacteria bacterium]